MTKIMPRRERDYLRASSVCAYVRPFVRCVVVVIIIAEKPAIHVMPRESGEGANSLAARGVVTKQWIVMLS